MGQLSLNFSFDFNAYSQSSVNIPSFPVSRTPAGFRVVMAPGLTTKNPPNPCLSCKENVGQDKELCSEFCACEAARLEYLESIGVAGLVGCCDIDSAGDAAAQRLKSASQKVAY